MRRIPPFPSICRTCLICMALLGASCANVGGGAGEPPVTAEATAGEAVTAERDRAKPAQRAAAEADAEPGCRRTDAGYTCLYGPIKVPGGGSAQMNSFVEAPPEAGFITSARATVVDVAGAKVPGHLVHLHHAVWLNPSKDDMICAAIPGDRFFGSGKERTRMQLPAGYGYHWDNRAGSLGSPSWFLVSDLMGMHEGIDKKVYIRLNLGFSADPEGTSLVDVQPVWLDVRNCGGSEFDVAGDGDPRRHKEVWTYTMPKGGRFVGVAGHLHDGGIGLRLRNVTTGAGVFTSDAIYGKRPRQRWYLTGMTSYFGDPGIAISEGDVLKLTAIYNNTRPWPDAMGIMMGALAPASAAR